MKNKIIIIICGIIVLVGLIVLLLLYTNKGSENNTSSNSTNSSNTSNTIEVKENNVDWDSEEEKEVSDSENGVNITESGTYTLTEEINGQVVINTSGNVKLILDNVTIKSSNGPCILVQEADNVLIYLEEGSTNVLEDSASYTGFEEETATIFSHDDLTIDGEGTLKVNANYEDAIVSKDDLTINSGTYKITSIDDAIRGKDSVYIKNGSFTINASGDGIKSSNDTETDKGYILIENGNFKITAGSDGIQAITKLVINGGTFDITSEEGLEATYIVINDGTIKISASDDGINASKKSTFMTPTIEINGGNITVNMGQGDTDALDANGNIYINGGTINITGQSAFDYDNEGKINGGEVTVNGQKITTMTSQMMGGHGGGQMGGQMPGGQQGGQMPGGHGGRR